MAPSSGHLLVPKAWRIVKFAASQTRALVQSKLPQTSGGSANAVLQPIRLPSKLHPIHSRAFLKQARSQCRWFSTTFRNLSSKASAQASKYDRVTFQASSQVGQAISRSHGTPFASSLRPNLTGGALPRSAGGYCLGGTGRGIRHFSHTPTAQAQVVQNVNAGIRAFCVGGGKARYDGVNPVTGDKKFKTVSKAEDHVLRKLDRYTALHNKGTNLEFRLDPTITAISSKCQLPTTEDTNFSTLGSAGFLDNLAVDFARAVKDLSAILMDLKRLTVFGDLPISLGAGTSDGAVLSVRFCGCDAEAVARLCDEVGIYRGIVKEDEAWSDDRDVEMALLFPFAPSNATSEKKMNTSYTKGTIQAENRPLLDQLDWRQMMSPSEQTSEYFDRTTDTYEEIKHIHASQSYANGSPELFLRDSSGYESLYESDYQDRDPYKLSSGYTQQNMQRQASDDFEGLEGIYRFLRECDQARR